MPVTINGNGAITGATVVQDPGSNGLVVRTSSSAAVARTITAGTGISVSNGDGVSGNPTITNSGVTSVNGQTGAVTISSGAPAAYDVGAYIVGHKNSAGSTATTAGETQSGSVLRFSTNNGFDQPITTGGSGANHRTPGLSGTWRAMQSVGSGQQIDGTTINFFNTLWCRVS